MTRANVKYDLSGSETAFKREDLRFVISRADQRISFNEPVFLNSIVVRKKNGASWDVLSNGAADGWVVDENDYDYDAVSDALLQNSAFNKNLVKSIILKVRNNASSNVTISVDYQRLRLDLNESYLYDGDGPEYSPALMAKVLTDIEFLRNRSMGVTDLFGASLEDHTYLEQDLTGLESANYIVNERHTVNVPRGQMFISPDRGSFYAHDLVVQGFTTTPVTLTRENLTSFYGKIFIYTESTRNEALNTTTSKERRVILSRQNASGYVDMSGHIVDNVSTWIEGTDYEIIGVNLAKTKISSHTSGVYEHIHVLKSYVGDVMISYHAFGGHVSTQDVIDIHKNLANLVSVIKGSGLVTDSSLYTHPLISELVKRLNAFDEFHNHYAQVEHIISVRDQGFHWYNIAFIYDNRWDGLEDSITDLGTFRIESLARNWSYEFDVITNIAADKARMFRVKTRACADDNTVTDMKNYIVLDERDNVYVRLCWVDNGEQSGVVLQYGMKFDKFVIPQNGVITETLIVTNKSGNASRWRLYSDPLALKYPSDDNFSMPVYDEHADDDDFTMPNGKTVWSTQGNGARQNVKPLEHEDGMIYWAGNYPMHLMMSQHTDAAPFQSQSRTILQPLVQDTLLSPQQVTGVSFDIFDRIAGCYFTVESPCRPNLSYTGSIYPLEIGGTGPNKEFSGQEVIFCLQDLCSLRYAFNTVNNVMQMSIITSLGTNSIINERFDLRQIRLHFN